MIHDFLGETISFNLVYKKRKTMGIYVDLYGNVEVRVPKDTTEKNVLQFLEDKWDWVLKNSNEMKEKTGEQKSKNYDHGENFLYLGDAYPIHIFVNIEIEQDYVEFTEEVLNIHVKQHEDERIKQALKRFYYQQCKSLVEKRIQINQKNFKTKPRSIRISDNKSNWGSCDAKMQLTFNWKLAMAPLDVIDYVVVHEMCHMVHLNHDRSFWRLVGKILPDYEEMQNWLALSSWKMVV